MNPPPAPPDDPGNGDPWTAKTAGGIRPETRFGMLVAQRLELFERELRNWTKNLDDIRDEVEKGKEGGRERGFAIRRLEDRLAEMFVDLKEIKLNYVRREDHEKDLAPFRKWASWVATLVIGAVITAVLATVLSRTGIR